jgi:hypothetical protein
MVNSGANEEESNTACLGAEIDDIVLEDEYTDWAPLLRHNSSTDKPFFEDTAEFGESLHNAESQVLYVPYTHIRRNNQFQIFFQQRIVANDVLPRNALSPTI